jgi:hypothetical protein
MPSTHTRGATRRRLTQVAVGVPRHRGHDVARGAAQSLQRTGELDGSHTQVGEGVAVDRTLLGEQRQRELLVSNARTHAHAHAQCTRTTVRVTTSTPLWQDAPNSRMPSALTRTQSVVATAVARRRRSHERHTREKIANTHSDATTQRRHCDRVLDISCLERCIGYAGSRSIVSTRARNAGRRCGAVLRRVRWAPSRRGSRVCVCARVRVREPLATACAAVLAGRTRPSSTPWSSVCWRRR